MMVIDADGLVSAIAMKAHVTKTAATGIKGMPRFMAVMVVPSAVASSLTAVAGWLNPPPAQKRRRSRKTRRNDINLRCPIERKRSRGEFCRGSRIGGGANAAIRLKIET
jgi:hypothetical protein